MNYPPVPVHSTPLPSLRYPKAVLKVIARRCAALAKNDSGLTTIEYAMCTLAAAAFAAVLYAVVSSDQVHSAIEGIIERALNS